ncbi:putative leucine-rich repeat domain superfamily [Helianthus annuus]|uniref:Leucine-rich repeat domain superfamily n=1 Tax=Helianthus annuus TaxID=4232 RepID=A0A251V3E3_HELAN|nr:putative leucine-rich repeat domain superfamily [Helianthus annuus]
MTIFLKLHSGWLYVDNMNPMPMLTTLTLESLRLEDKHLNQLNKCFPNLQVLNLLYVTGPTFPKINLLNLKTCHCHWGGYNYNNPSSLTLITPKLITLKIECLTPAEIHVEAPMLSHFHLRYNFSKHAGAFTAKKFENFYLTTLWVDSLYLSSFQNSQSQKQ